MEHRCDCYRCGYRSGDMVVTQHKKRYEKKNRQDLAPYAKPSIFASSYSPQGQPQQQQKREPEQSYG